MVEEDKVRVTLTVEYPDGTVLEDSVEESTDTYILNHGKGLMAMIDKVSLGMKLQLRNR